MGYYRNDLVSAASGYGGSSHGGHGGCYCPQSQQNDLLVLAAAAAAAFLLIPLITMMRRRKRRNLDEDNLGHVVSWVYTGNVFNYQSMLSLLFYFIVYIRCCHLITKGPQAL